MKEKWSTEVRRLKEERALRGKADPGGFALCLYSIIKTMLISKICKQYGTIRNK